MSNLVYILHCTIVFGVPTLFGWVFLRRAFQEANWLVLAPGAVVTGIAALMAIVNELRFFFEMRLAVWFTYKLLLLLALAMTISLPAGKARAQLPRRVKRASRILLLLLGVLCSSAYFGIPALRGILDDAWWFHYPTAIQIQNVERFPLTHVFSPDDHLYYHYGPDIVASTWSFLLEQPVQIAFALYVLILAPCTFLLAFALSERVSRNYWSAIFGASFLTVGGNLRFLLFLTGKYSSDVGSMQVFNSQIIQGMSQMMFTPSHTFGLPLLLASVLLFRHVCVRPQWSSTVALGLFMGTFTLVSEWYVLPLLAGLLFVMLRSAVRHRRLVGGYRPGRITLSMLPAVIVLFWGAFNNTYISGIFGHFWMRYQSIEESSRSREVVAGIEFQSRIPRQAAPERYQGIEEGSSRREIVAGMDLQSRIPRQGAIENVAANRETPRGVRSVTEHSNREPPFAPTVEVYRPQWTVPDLVPLRLNLSHFGKVPSWESAESAGSSYVAILSVQFLLEAFPIFAIGVPLSFWFAWHRRSPIPLLLAWIAIVSAIPPIFLDWGYRSTDFLRFFTLSFSMGALFLGWAAGDLIVHPQLSRKLLGILFAVCCLVNPVGLGILGLIPGNIEKVKQLADTAASLSTLRVDPDSDVGPPRSNVAPASNEGEMARHRAFEKLATETGDFLFPISKGRERAVVIVPPELLPRLTKFPEWMKMATFSRLPLPVGRHWNDSLYSAYYRDAVSRLDIRALAALDAKWVIITNLFRENVPIEVAQALDDDSRFMPVATFREGKYYMSTFRVLP